jgi:pyruvate ferredoxin oxidoreductase alpha subunit
MAQGTAVLGGSVYSYFRYQQHLVQQNALAVHEEIAAAFAACCGRHYGLVEPFQLDDADYVLMMSNAFATKGKAAVQRLRAHGLKVGLLRLRVVRPFPAAAIAAALAGSLGSGSDRPEPGAWAGWEYLPGNCCRALCHSEPATLAERGRRPGGKDISDAEFDAVFHDLQRAAAGEHLIGSHLLYAQPEQELLQTLPSAG